MSKYLIALDDGHGMNTAGKRTPVLPNGLKSKDTGKNFMHENEFNRAVKRLLKDHLERSGFRVLLVAPTDADTPLKTRTDLANARQADAYVSIHANAFDGKFDGNDPDGIETFHHPNSVNGKRLATLVHNHLIKGTKQKNRGVKSANFHVLRETETVAILVEAGFMDNLYEAKLLLSDSFREEVALEIAKGICEYFKVPFVDKKVTKVTPSTKLYRVRKSWTDAKSQIGAYSVLASAINLANTKVGYKVYDENGIQIHPVVNASTSNELYRVRKSWADVKSQLGAYKVLNSAKELADKNKGYKVFNSKGSVVYTPKTEPKPEVKPVEPKPVVNAKDLPSIGAVDSWNWATQNGLLDGTRPKDFITREQVAIVLKRVKDKGIM